MMVLLPGRTFSPPPEKSLTIVKDSLCHFCLPLFRSARILLSLPKLHQMSHLNKMRVAHFARRVPTMSNHEGQNGLDLF